MPPIYFCEPEYYAFSNFSSHMLDWKGRLYITSECAYQAEKFNDETMKDAICAMRSTHEVYEYAHKHKSQQRSDWDEVKVSCMKEILREKVQQHLHVLHKLIESGDRELIKDLEYDSFWGWGADKNGKNMLGKLWMEIRQEYVV